MAQGKRVVAVIGGAQLSYIRALRRKGFAVEVVRHGEMALVGLLQPPPDVLIIECLGGDERAVGLIELIRHSLGWETLPLVLLEEGRLTLSQIDRMTRCRVDCAMPYPPWSPKDVVRSVSELLGLAPRPTPDP